MSYLTDRKRAVGNGAGSEGTHHHWKMMVSSICLVVLVPFFVFTFGAGLGGTYEDVQAYFSSPFVALVMALGLIVGLRHFKMEIDEAVEDYVHGLAQKLTLIAVNAATYVLMAVGLFALLKLAL
ncbi:succinate dehydrogenase, hydrophobic membrane anchor protein [Pseudooceanicola onchidii]|uniref:succinate dehydrogenase, hydrophobic membrane anchor protein n=1 Tax=Pseudooceanicola onchidii TaxID=2562279 RepID=UPI0010AA0EFA|nr:succinate dehydrogenase, hydrophobic membrane anchor protein [Pseudooceanicola onchidii]